MPAETFYVGMIFAMCFSGLFSLAWIQSNRFSVTSIVLVIIKYAALIAFLFWNIGPTIESKATHEIKLSNAGYPYYEYKGGICIIDPKQNVKEGDLAVFTTRYRTTKIGLNFEPKTTLEIMAKP